MLAASAREIGAAVSATAHDVDLCSGHIALSLPADCDFVAVTLEQPPSRLYTLVDEACLAQKIPWTSLRRNGLSLELGPTIIPGQTPCFHCYEMRRAAHTEAGDQLFRPSHAGFNLPLGVDELAAEIVKFLTGFGDVRTLGSLLIMNPLAMTMTSHRVQRLPRCPRCRPARAGPPVLHWRPEG
jgi:bacteriocin biosynthesis cyclodehydratase domain-containing protein